MNYRQRPPPPQRGSTAPPSNGAKNMAGNNRITPMGIGARDVTPEASITPHAGASIRSGLGQTEMTVHAETHALAAAAREEALIKAKIAVALQRPRNWAHVEQILLEQCEVFEFAEEAVYSKPIGYGDEQETIEGLSVRFAEEAILAAGNVSSRTYTSSEDPYMRKVTVVVMDLENMVEYSDEFSIEKTVVRKKVFGKEEIITERIN